MSRSARHAQFRWKRRALVASVFLCGVVLFTFYMMHGISRSDRFYALEILMAWALTIFGCFAGVRSYRRGNSFERRIIASGLAILLSTMVIVLLFGSYSDAPPSIPQPSDSGMGGY